MTDHDDTRFSSADFRRVDEKPDELFYSMPRLVTHIDDAACAALSAFYETHLRDGDRILDLMSSCVSHLPSSLRPAKVVGHGMNMTELAANPQLDDYVVQNLNKEPELPFEEASFDACLIAVSVQYLVNPLAVFDDVARVLRPGGLIAVSFSNRMFPTKAVAIWRATGDAGHGRLVADYLNDTRKFEDTAIDNISPQPGRTDPLFIVTARRS